MELTKEQKDLFNNVKFWYAEGVMDNEKENKKKFEEFIKNLKELIKINYKHLELSSEYVLEDINKLIEEVWGKQ